REPAPAVVAPIALATCAARDAQMLMKGAALPLVPPDVPVDGFVADAERPPTAQRAGDLFRTPFLPQQRFHLRQLCLAEALVAPTAAAPRPRALLGLMHPIAAVMSRTVAPQLPPERAA